MSGLINQWQIKLELVQSLTKSQQALSKILDGIAELTTHSPETAKLLSENIASLTALQQTIADKMLAVSWQRPKTGVPPVPWYSDNRLAIGAMAQKGVAAKATGDEMQ